VSGFASRVFPMLKKRRRADDENNLEERLRVLVRKHAPAGVKLTETQIAKIEIEVIDEMMLEMAAPNIPRRVATALVRMLLKKGVE
jgi:hypothetical protein